MKYFASTFLAFLFCCFAVQTLRANSRQWYVSPSGSDTNDGSLGAPFKTLAKGVQGLQPGDTLWLRAGTYRETLAPTNSGAGSAPIIIAAYNNEDVTISGCDTINGPWSLTSNGIYTANAGWDLGEGYNQVFVDGVMQYEAQFPNHGSGDLLHPALVSATVSNTYTITSGSFASLGNVSGARFWGCVGLAWASQAGVITSNTGTTLTVDQSTIAGGWWWPNASGDTSATATCFIYGSLSLLDSDGEWYLNSAGPVLSLRINGSADPTGHVVEMKHRNWCVDINNVNFVTVSGIKARAGAIRLNGTGNVLTNCNARFLSHFLTYGFSWDRNGSRDEGGGVVLGGTGNTVSNCTIYDTAGSGILTSGSGHSITRNHIYNVNYSGTYATGLSLNDSNHVATFNTIHDAGRDLLTPEGTGHTILYSDLYNCGLLCKDCSAVYVWGQNATGSDGKSTRIAYNWVHDGNPDPAMAINGIYLDNQDCYFQVDHNVIWNFAGGLGFYINSPAYGHKLYHNSLLACGTYDTSTYSMGPTGDYYSFWKNHNGMSFTAQNNLVLTDKPMVNMTLVNPVARDFRPQAGSKAVDPALFTSSVTWTTTDYKNGIPSGFTLSVTGQLLPFTFSETTGQGVVLPGINDGYAGSTPDSGAYEFAGPLWQPGIAGWAVGDAMILNGGVANLARVGLTVQCTVQGTLVSAGLPSAKVDVFWGTADGGNSATNWQNSATLSSALTGNSLPLSYQLTNLPTGTVFYFRFRATNAQGSYWTDAGSFLAPTDWEWDADPATAGPQNGSGIWNTSSQNWWNSATNITFTNGNSVIFGSGGGSAGTITLSGANITAEGITFKPVSSGTCIITHSASETLTLLGSGITANESAQFYFAPSIGASQTWNIATGKTLAFTDSNRFVRGLDPGETLTLSGTGQVKASGAKVTVNSGTTSSIAIGTSATLDMSRGSSNYSLYARDETDSVDATINLIGSGKLLLRGAATSGSSGYPYFGGVVNFASFAGMIEFAGSGNLNAQPGTQYSMAVDAGVTVDLCTLGDTSTVGVDGLTGSGTILRSTGPAATINLEIGENNTTNGGLSGIAQWNGTITATGGNVINLIKKGTGIQIFNGTDQRGGGTTTIQGGTLLLPKPGVLDGYGVSGKVVVNSGGALALTAGGTGEWTAADVAALPTKATFNAGSQLGIAVDGGTILSYTNAITGAVGLTKLGAGTLVLPTNNTYTGPTTISSGTLQIGLSGKWSGSIRTSSAISIASGATLVFIGSTGGYDFGGYYNQMISGGGGLTLNGGSLTMQNTNSTFDGNINVLKGILTALRYYTTSLAVFGSTLGVTLINSDGTTTTGGQVILCSNGITTDPLYENFVIQGPGESGNNTVAALAIQEGSTTLNGNTTLSGTGTYRLQEQADTIKNITWSINGNVVRIGTNSGTLRLDFANTVASGTSTIQINGNIGNNGGAVEVLTSNGSINSQLVFASNGHDIGDFTINGGISGLPTVKLSGVSNALATSKNLTITRGTFDLAGNNQTINALIGSGTASTNRITNSLASTTGTLTVGNGNGSGTFTGIIQDGAGKVALTKIGTGTLTLGATNSYTGVTTVQAGTLSLSSPNSLSSATDITLSLNSTLDLNFSGTGTVHGLIINGVALSPGTWGSPTSTAQYKTSHMTGSGIVNVTSGPGGLFNAWTAAQGLDATPGKETGFGNDPDHDGIANGLEWILGGNPLASDPAIRPQVTSDTTALRFSFSRNRDSIATTTLITQWSPDLQTWHNVLIGASSSGPDADGVTATVTQSGANFDQVTVAVPLANSTAGKIFARIQATLF